MELINTKKKNPKKLSFISIYFLGINGVIGSGAFLLPQVIYKDMDLASVPLLRLAWLRYVMRTFLVVLQDQVRLGFIHIMHLAGLLAMSSASLRGF